jgi:hypothetical protein
MIGEHLESDTKFSFGAIFWALVGLALLAFAVKDKNIHQALFAALPICVAGGLWIAAGKRFQAIVGEDRLQFHQPRYSLPYEEIRAVRYHGSARDRNESLAIDTRRGTIALPGKVNLPLDRLHVFLSARIAPQTAAEPHPEMANYVQAQRDTFGPERVEVYRARKKPSFAPFRLAGRGVYVSLGAMLAGTFWVAASFAIDHKDRIAWTIWGFLLLCFGGIFCYYFKQKTGAQSKIARENADACLVISPLGIAMIQGDMRGKLHWDEIRKVVAPGKGRGFQVRAVQGLRIFVEGSEIQVLDIYDRSLSEIEITIRHNCNL